MTTYYVNNATGNDSNDGSIGTPWKTVNKGLAGATGGVDHTIMVAPGNYYSEGIVATFNSAGGKVTLIADGGTVNMRQSATPAYAGWVWWCTATDASQYVFSGHFNFDMSTIAGKYWVQGNGSAAKFTFTGCEFSAGGVNAKVFASSGVKNVSLDRCYLHDIANYPFQMVGGFFKMEACFAKDITGTTWFIGNMDWIKITNCTWVNVALSQYLSVTYGHLSISNNIFAHDTPTVTPVALTGVISGYSISNNIGFKTAPSSPRQSVQTNIISLSNEPNYYDSAVYLDPGFTTAPALSATSFALGRGINNGIRKAFTLTGSGASFFSGPPVIGCWAPTSSIPKQQITRTPLKVAVVGDSITHGVGMSPPDIYGNRLETALPSYTFMKMPGDTTRHLGISGIVSMNSWKIASEFTQSGSPQIVTVLIGVNDLGGGNRDPDYTIRVIIEYLDSVADLGAKPIYLGCMPVSANPNPANTDIADSLAVEDAVHAHCVLKGYRSARVCRDFYETAGYDTLYYDPADYLHPNHDGHARIAVLAQPLIEDASTEPGSYVSALDLRFGVDRGDGVLGALRVPTASQTLLNVLVDATTGNVVQPSATTVLDTVSFGPNGGTPGTWHAPSAGEVISTAVFGPSSATAGTFVRPAESTVEDGVQFGAGGTQYTGTLDVSGLVLLQEIQDQQDRIEAGGGGVRGVY